MFGLQLPEAGEGRGVWIEEVFADPSLDHSITSRTRLCWNQATTDKTPPFSLSMLDDSHYISPINLPSKTISSINHSLDTKGPKPATPSTAESVIC